MNEKKLLDNPKDNKRGELQLRELRRVPLHYQVAERIREAILNGELEPGRALTEVHLAAHLKVSRAPVREAIRMLAEEGLLETTAYKGTIVRTLTQQDIEEVYSLRELLETFAIRRIVSAGEPVDFNELEASCEKMRRFAESGDWAKLNLEDEKFHKTVIAMANHNLLSHTWTTLSLLVRQIMALRNQQNRDPMEVALNHPPIVESLKSRDLGRALQLIHVHVTSAADLTLDSWQEEEGA